MARLKHVTTGVVVDVADEKVERLGAEWRIDDGTEAPASNAEIELPDGDPDESWSVPQLKALAAEEGLDIKGLRTKPQILAAFDAAAETGTEPEQEAHAGDGAEA